MMLSLLRPLIHLRNGWILYGILMNMELTPQQELFCRFYTQNSELFSNATLSYAEAYEYKLDECSQERPIVSNNPTVYGESEYQKAYNTCSALASRLLRNDKIQKRVVQLLNEYLKDEVVDAELAKVIMQSYKLESKIAGIREYNKLKQRIIDRAELNVILPSPILGGTTTDVSTNNSS